MDRDGVVIENVDAYVRSWSDVVILPKALSAIVRLSRTAYKIIIVTNQSAVGRGIISIETAQEINARLRKAIHDSGGRVDGLFMCPHAPEALCGCRKPMPGLILQAASSLGIDLARSILVGDALTDLQAGRAAGVGINVLVRTGRGAQQAKLPEAASLAPFLIYDGLENVVDLIFSGLLS